MTKCVKELICLQKIGQVKHADVYYTWYYIGTKLDAWPYQHWVAVQVLDKGLALWKSKKMKRATTA